MGTNTYVLALDVGERRVGVALASSMARIARPLTTLTRSAGFIDELRQIIEREHVGTLVIGLPRGLKGQETAQTHAIQTFGKTLQNEFAVPIVWQDEALTSVQAEMELATRKRPATKADVDALAATYILEDFLHEQTGVAHD